ncbi:protein FAM234B [Aplysia californica]|uniref:Protein FAM234B n=1 Tax=Aplysia californica TaxID=6500 RepID=A0ABM1VVU1_APLCA|nr:protein FAM234B [Aplysia californica]XP_005101850.1 protein FAM234B [Aplysia californica]XP_035826533.1 protein FAM234B [Aplysia californica]
MSSSPSVKYQPLSQWTASDEEDEGFDDNVLYDSRLVNGPTMDRRNVFELERLGHPRSSRSSTSVQYAGSSRRTCVLVTVLMVIILGALAAVLFPLLNHAFNHGKVMDISAGHNSQDWTRAFKDSWTESNIRQMDVNGDGADDILIGVADQSAILSLLKKPSDVAMKKHCALKGTEYPCGGHLVALRGYDGKELWRTATRSVVIHHSCADIDVNGDEANDCLVTGRHSTCQAVDLQTGKLLWVIDPDSVTWSSHFVPDWNVYQAVTIPDVDLDGTLDIVLSHGGDKDKEPWDHERAAGRLIILSGRSGTPIGAYYLELPPNQETYMPPVKYVADTGAIYILFGSGGETMPGNLMAISVPDLYKIVSGGNPMPNVDLSLYTWLKDVDERGISVLYSDKTKGVMVPPVLVDVNNDEQPDILVTTFSGEVALIDGSSLTTTWAVHFTGMETYSSPSPGFYNDDSVVDFLVHFNEGEWDTYNGSQTLVLSGTDGSTLWTFEGSSYSYSSDLSLRTSVENLDAFIVKVVGRNASDKSWQVETDLNYKRRHLAPEKTVNEDLHANFTDEEFQLMCSQVEQDMQSKHPSCDRDLSAVRQEVLLFDRLTSTTPLRILEEKPLRHHYQLPHKPGSRHCHPLSERYKDKVSLCSVLIPSSYTGAVGDVDGDGLLDYTHISQMTGFLQSDTFDITSSVSQVIVSRHSLRTAVAEGELVSLNISQASPESVVSDPLQHFQSLRFLPTFSQVWTEYLGSKGNDWYYFPP